MSKTVRMLIGCLAALLLLVGAYFGVITAFPETEENVSSDSSSSVESVAEVTNYIYQHRASTLKQATVTTANAGVYHVNFDGVNYSVPELENIEHFSSSVNSCAERLCSFPYYSIANESPTEAELEEYGLISPQASAVIELEDATEQLYVGKKTDDGYYYVKTEGSDTVYLCVTGVNTYLLKGHLSFINTTLFYCAEDNRSGIDNFVLKNSLLEDDVCISKTDSDSKSALAVSSSYCVTHPFVMGVDSETFDTGILELIKFGGSEAVAIKDSTTDLSQYRLDDPQYILSFTYQKPLTDTEVSEGKEENDNKVEKYKFYVSSADESGNMYCYADGSDVIMIISKASYSLFDWTMDDMAGDMFLSPFIWYLDRMEITFEGKEYEFNFTISDKSLTAVNYLNRQLDADNFKKFYQVVLGTGRIGMGMAEENAETHMEIRFVYQDDLDKDDDVIVFKDYSVRQYAAEVNGIGKFTVAKTRVDKLERDLIKVINNEPVNAFIN